ncbi:hypothetical protein H4S07_004247 [Coemansia furcata]|uniref:Uncharacterized protein n=1 Tax=Coemansia furcata TaxID=417177 RepID=A0ACC1LAW4_9FUNG|nr:hypothetical protein H4S07_004247 [Coemansia furcata]
MSQQKKAPWDRDNKYWCNYCRIFVHDNKTTRNLHDSGAKHKDNVQKFLRQIQKDEEARNKAEKKLDAQLKSIEDAATVIYNKDVAAHRAEAAPPAISKEKAHVSAKATEKPSGQSEKKESAVVEADTRPSRPDNVGIVGAWEVVEEVEEEAVASTSLQPAHAQNLRGSEWLDQEEDTSDRLHEFDIKEMTVSRLTEHGGEEPQAATVASDGAAMSLFKKRRAATNRTTRKQQKL